MSNNTNETILEQGAEGKLQDNSEQHDFFIDNYPEKKAEEAWEENRNQKDFFNTDKKTIFNDKNRFYNWITQKN
jgi:hypothetical protein